MAGAEPILIDQVRDLPSKENYTSISVIQGYAEKMFNGVAGMVTRKIKISGVRLVWDQYHVAPPGAEADDVSSNLYNYSGSNDIESLEMYADEVVIKSRLEFPQTDVWICARRVIFERDGCIVITPLPYYTPALSAKHDDRGRPLDAAGQIRAKDGANGLPGGSVTLCLPEGEGGVIVPAPFKDFQGRIITVGGKGQDGEDGGYLDYVAKPGQSASPSDESCYAFLSDSSVEDILYPHASSWRWPDNWKTDLSKYRVLHVKLDLFNDSAWTAVTNPRHVHTAEDSGRREWPGGVPDAFPSGKGGDGGNGGAIRSFWALGGVVSADAAENETPTSLVFISDKSGGQPGTSKEIRARHPQYATDSGTPPAFMRMNLVYRTPPIESARSPAKWIETCPFPIVAGKGALPRPGQPGKPASNLGPFSSEVTGGFPVPADEEQRGQLLQKYPNGWPNALVIQPVLRYARDAYLNGHRTEAREILQTYSKVLDWVPTKYRSAAMAAQATEIEALLTQIRNNLDYYGNPPGWLPRLSLVSNLQLFKSDQNNAVSLLYFAYKLNRSWDVVQDRARLLKSTRQALAQGIELARKSFSEGLTLLESSRAELTAVEGQINAIKDQTEALNNSIIKSAKDKAKEQQILAGVAGLASGLCKIVPVGQPYLGSAGEVLFNPLAKIDLANPNALEEAFNFAGGVGEGLTSFVATNKEALLEDSKDSFTKKLALVEGNLQSIETETAAINDQIETDFDSKVAAYTDSITAKIAALEGEAATITDAAKKKKKQEETLSFKQELALYKTRKIEGAILSLRKQVDEADQKALTQAERDARTNLLAKLKTVQDQKTELEKKSKTLTQKRDDQQVFLTKALDQASRIGQGIGSVASGLAKIVVPVDANSPEVVAIKAKIAESPEYKAQFESLMKAVDDLSARKQRMMEGIERAQHQMAECCATIANNLVQSAAIGRQFQSMSDALDLGVKEFAQGLKQRSEQRLRKSLYHVVKSYEYHYLNRVRSDFFSIDVINKIVELEEAKRKVGDQDPLLGEDDFKTIYEMVFMQKFKGLGDEIIDQLQHLKPSMQNKYICVFNPEHLQRLNDTWRFDFDIVKTFGKTGGKPEDVIGARILGIAIHALDVATKDGGLSLDIEFRHSGQHVIADSSGTRYSFRIGKYPVEILDGSGRKNWVDDHPISWRMIYNASDDPLKRVTLDEDTPDDKIALYLLREYKDKSDSGAQTLEEHRPAFTSNITLTIDGGLNLNTPEDVQRKKFKTFKINKLSFFVFFKRQ
jgi:hypothetical protein